MALAQAPVVDVSSGDRLSFTLFLAAVLHGLIIFGIAFELAPPGDSSPSVIVTLATAESSEEPPEADFVAQNNQAGSGTLDEVRQITTDRLSPFSSQLVRPTQRLQETRPTTPDSAQTRVITAVEAEAVIVDKKISPRPVNDAGGAQEQTIQNFAREIASLTARLDRQRQQYAKRPRERVLTSVSTRASRDAAWLNEWARKVETVGNQNFPREAIRQRVTGNLRLQSVIKWDGSLIEAEILDSSGHRILDDAALQIVHRSAPFLPFPPEIRKDTDQLVIIRTWHFDITGLSTSQ